jgi:hypothetical protein
LIKEEFDEAAVLWTRKLPDGVLAGMTLRNFLPDECGGRVERKIQPGIEIHDHGFALDDVMNHRE